MAREIGPAMLFGARVMKRWEEGPEETLAAVLEQEIDAMSVEKALKVRNSLRGVADSIDDQLVRQGRL